jgi:DNA-binding transcriptional LysR family regulator
VLELTRNGKADLAYGYAAHPIDLRDLAVRPLADDSLMLVLPPSHPPAAAPVVDVADLAGEAWISGTSFACAESLRAICGVAGFTPIAGLDSIRYRGRPWRWSRPGTASRSSRSRCRPARRPSSRSGRCARHRHPAESGPPPERNPARR